MSQFCDVIDNIIPLDSDTCLNIAINFRQIVDWGTYSKEDIKELQIFDPEHNDFDKFLPELKLIQDRNTKREGRYVGHNFNHLLGYL